MEDQDVESPALEPFDYPDPVVMNGRFMPRHYSAIREVVDHVRPNETVLILPQGVTRSTVLIKHYPQNDKHHLYYKWDEQKKRLKLKLGVCIDYVIEDDEDFIDVEDPEEHYDRPINRPKETVER